MASGEPPPEPRGDEAALFREFNDELLRLIRRSVRTTPEITEDACAFAWAQFLRYQPDRERNWRGWLFRVAQYEAWSLDRAERSTVHLRASERDEAEFSAPEPADPRDVLRIREELAEVVDVVGRLPPRLQRLVLLHAAGHRYADITELTGDSYTRVNALLARARERIRNERAKLEPELRRPVARTERLEALEADPPDWMRAHIGAPPRRGRRDVGSTAELLLWRRAALALDDYRRDHKPDLGGEPAHRPPDRAALRAWGSVVAAIQRLEAARTVDRGLEWDR